MDAAEHDARMDRLVADFTAWRRTAGPQIDADGLDERPEGDRPDQTGPTR